MLDLFYKGDLAKTTVAIKYAVHHMKIHGVTYMVVKVCIHTVQYTVQYITQTQKGTE